MTTTKESYINSFLILKNMPYESQIKINSEEIKLPVTISPDGITKENKANKLKLSITNN